MKTLIKKSLLIVAVLATTLTIANEDRTFSVNANAEKTTVSINDVEEGQQLSIIDQNNIVIYKETINKNGNYNKTFDLTALPNGDYFFELEKTLKVHTIPFTVAYNNVTFNKDKETVVYKPSVRLKSELLFVSQLSTRKSPLKIELFFDKDFNGDYELIHTETLENDITLDKVFKLSEKEKGNYKLVFTTEGRVFEEKFDL